MTPMIDVVFLLIIFFLVSSHLSRQETRFPVSLVEAGSGQSRRIEDVALTLAIDAEGYLRFGSEAINIDQLNNRINAWQQSQPRWDGVTASKPSVRLRIDHSVRYRVVEPILKSLSQLGIDRIDIVVAPPND